MLLHRHFENGNGNTMTTLRDLSGNLEVKNPDEVLYTRTTNQDEEKPKRGRPAKDKETTDE